MPNLNDGIGLSGDTENIKVLLNETGLHELSLLFPNVNSIMVPKKARHDLRTHVPKKLLKTVDPNIDTAVEKCLLMLSNLAMTYYTDDKWKTLYSPILHEQTKVGGNNSYVYTKIIEVLKQGTAQGGFIQVSDKYSKGKSRQYRLTDTYLRGLNEYTIKDERIIQKLNAHYYTRLRDIFANPICRNLVAIYPRLELPTSKELLKIGKQLVSDGYITKKGKILTMRNKHPNHYWKDYDSRSFVEDNIKLYEYLTHRGFMIPHAGDNKCGGRVVDSFVLMPTWIREQITIDGKKLEDCDYTALHPNIAMKLYDGKQDYITHQKVADNASIDVGVVKKEHLAFFNKRWVDMKKSPLFKYYSQSDPLMLEALRKDKAENGYKITSQRMFKVEVDIMTDVITELNGKGVEVLYIYDALLCEEADKATVSEIMNRIILEYGVKTKVKAEVNQEPQPTVSKVRLCDEVNLYELLPAISFTVDESMMIITDFNRSKVLMKELVMYIGSQLKQQKYNDYGGVMIDANRVELLKRLIKA